jgi:hypothetical protein
MRYYYLLLFDLGHGVKKKLYFSTVIYMFFTYLCFSVLFFFVS